MKTLKCAYRVAAGEHVFCASPKVSLTLTRNYLTLDHAGTFKPETKCERCPWAGPIDKPPRPFVAVEQVIEHLRDPKFRASPKAPAEFLPSMARHGPGTKLHELLSQLGFSIGGCSCKSWLNKMDAWGVEGCREHRAEIIEHLTTMKDAASLTAKLRAGASALANGLPLSIPGLVDEAIERAT